jgi:hypothetical protein
MRLAPNISNLGRHVFGVAALAFGLITLVWHNYKDWDQLRYILNAADGPVFVYAAAAAQIFGGTAIQFRRTAKTGAVFVGAVYLAFAVLGVPLIITTPQIYNSWGNFFEQLSLVTGAGMIYFHMSSAWTPEILIRVGRNLMGICVTSFTLEQAVYLDATAKLVPKWLPPSQMFWAITTTVLFTLAAVALLTNRMALLATRLLTAMIVIFGLLVWIPMLLSDPHSHANWSESAETFAIAGTAWILADLLGEFL